jgi:hypothetical protein
MTDQPTDNVSSPQDGAVDKPAVTCRASVLWFADQMELALRRNDHKGGWEAMDQEALVARCGDELDELRQCWDRATGKQVRGSYDIIAEAADVANFAMMVADLSGPKHGM